MVACLFSACHKHTHDENNHQHEHAEEACCEHNHEEDSEDEHSGENAIAFHIEQQEKIDFAVEEPQVIPFGQVIYTVGQIESAQTDEAILSAKTSGVVVFNQVLAEGQSVRAGQVLLTISSAGTAENDFQVRFAEAQARYQQSESGYKRAQSLANDKIVSDKELAELKSRYETDKAVYDNLKRNFSSNGQSVSGRISGFVKQLFVANGQFVEAGQPLVSLVKNQSLVLRAEVPVKYASYLPQIVSANIQTPDKQQFYSLKDLNGRLLSYGKSLNEGENQLPVVFQMDNRGGFIPGGLVELYIQTKGNQAVITLPNSALTEEQGVYSVFVQLSSEAFEKREVKTGATDGLRTEIRSGIAENEKVVTQGAMSVKLAQSAGALDPHAGHVH